MKEIIEAFMTRIKSPVFGYFILSWIALNWKPLFYLFFSDTTVDDRFAYFNIATNFSSLVIYPFLIATAIAISYPWINYGFLWLCKKPTEFRNYLQAESEHKLIMKKQQLEEAHSALLATKEKDLINRAKRDEEVQTIADKETKEKLQKEIEILRKQIDKNKSKNNIDNILVSDQEALILKLFIKYIDGLSKSDIRRLSTLNTIETDYCLDELVKKGFLLTSGESRFDRYDGYILSALGRAYLVKNNLLPKNI